MEFKEGVVTMHDYRNDWDLNFNINLVETYKSFTKLKELMYEWHDHPDVENTDDDEWYEVPNQSVIEDALIKFVRDWDYEKRVHDYCDAQEAIMLKESEKEWELLEKENQEDAAVIEVLRNKYPELLEKLLEESDEV